MLFDGGPIPNPFGATLGRKLSDLEKMVMDLAERQNAQFGADDSLDIWVRITGNGAGTGEPVWTYSGSQVVRSNVLGASGMFTTLSGGATFTNTLVNSLEDGNDSSTAFGIGVTEAGGYWYFTDAPFTGNRVMPVPSGGVYRVRTMTQPDGSRCGVFESQMGYLPGCPT